MKSEYGRNGLAEAVSLAAHAARHSFIGRLNFTRNDPLPGVRTDAAAHGTPSRSYYANFERRRKLGTGADANRSIRGRRFPFRHTFCSCCARDFWRPLSPLFSSGVGFITFPFPAFGGFLMPTEFRRMWSVESSSPGYQLHTSFFMLSLCRFLCQMYAPVFARRHCRCKGCPDH